MGSPREWILKIACGCNAISFAILQNNSKSKYFSGNSSDSYGDSSFRFFMPIGQYAQFDGHTPETIAICTTGGNLAYVSFLKPYVI